MKSQSKKDGYTPPEPKVVKGGEDTSFDPVIPFSVLVSRYDNAVFSAYCRDFRLSPEAVFRKMIDLLVADRSDGQRGSCE